MAAGMRGRGRKFKAEINVVPYIDVMLVLLVIFMVVAPISNPSVINLPTAERSAQPPTDYIEVTLKPDQSATVSVRGKNKASEAQSAKGRTDLLGKLDALHRSQPELPLLVAADKDIRYEEVIHTISEARKLGITRVGLATR